MHVDRRVELMSIISILAGFREYSMGRANPYRTDVVTAFRPFLAHPAVDTAKRLRAEKGIGYDAPMILALHLDHELALQNAAELPRLDARWKGVDAEAYAAQLRDFARDAKLDAFMTSHRDHYATIEKLMRGAVDAESPVAWFDGAFGKRDNAHYTVIPAPMTGTYNFGVRATRADGTLDMFQLLAIDTETGLPVVDADLAYLLVHEMAHSYVNPILAEHEAELGPPAQKLFAQVAEEMTAQAYPTWQIFLAESVVRAATYVYLEDNKGPEVAAKALALELKNGFRWTLELAALIRGHQKERIDFVPRLTALLARLGQG